MRTDRRCSRAVTRAGDSAAGDLADTLLAQRAQADGGPGTVGPPCLRDFAEGAARAIPLGDLGVQPAFVVGQRVRGVRATDHDQLGGERAEPLHLPHPLDGLGGVQRTQRRAVQRVQQVKGLGPFAAELVVVRGANAPDALPRHERRLDAEIAERYGPGRTLGEVSEAWRPYRTWAAVCLRALREQRTGEIAGR